MTLYRELRERGARDRRRLVEVERTGERAIVTMNEPERLNPLSAGLNLQLQERLKELAADPTLRAIVLTGADPAFSTGGDLEMIASGTTAIRDADAPSDTTDAWRWIRRQFGGVARLTRPPTSSLSPPSTAPRPESGSPGRSPATSSSPRSGRYSSRHSGAWGWFRRPAQAGFSPAGSATTVRSPTTCAAAISAPRKRFELGLVEEVCPHDELRAAAEKWCERSERLPAHALEMTKPLLRAAADASWEESLRLEEFAEANCFSTAALGEEARGILRGHGSGDGEAD